MKTPIQAETPKRFVDYNVYPPSATSDRKGWAVTIAGEYVKVAPFACRKDAETYAQSEVIKKRAASNLSRSDSTTADPKPKTSLPYKLGGTNDPHFDHEAGELSRTEATCDWYDHLRDDGRSDGQGESYSERNT